MTTLEQSLVTLVNEGLVTTADAKAKANRPEEVAANAFPEFAGGIAHFADEGSVEAFVSGSLDIRAEEIPMWLLLLPIGAQVAP